jgi:hypothetical protein
MAIAFGGGIFGGYGPPGGSIVGGGTSGQIAYWNGSSGITGGSVATISGTIISVAGTISMTGPLLNGATKALTSGVTVDLFTLPLANGAMIGGMVLWRVTSAAAGGRETLTGISCYTANRDGATYNSTVETIGTPVLAPSGTSDLTGALTVASAAGLLTVSANFETTLASAALSISYRVISPDNLAITEV